MSTRANLEAAHQDLAVKRALVAEAQVAIDDAAALVRAAQEAAAAANRAIIESDGGKIIEGLALARFTALSRLDALQARHADRMASRAAAMDSARDAEIATSRATLDFERETVADLNRTFDERITAFATDAIDTAKAIGDHVQTAARALASIPGEPAPGMVVSSLFTTREEIIAAFEAAYDAITRNRVLAEHAQRGSSRPQAPAQVVAAASVKTITAPDIERMRSVRDQRGVN